MTECLGDYVLRGSGPYRARSAIEGPVTRRLCRLDHAGFLEWYGEETSVDDWENWFVTNKSGRNILSFKSQPGAIFTSKEDAEAIAANANRGFQSHE